ncbi:MAG: response regulator transcription factor [Burkholderiales bacterium]|nr:response regulator transcription factor [Burkholderiales bacterium]MDR4517605.1 response regulator transcription factor [Nitrosomonas sp.]
MKVLIIEDNKDIAASIYDYLEAYGYTVDAAGDGVTGLHLAVSGNYDAIILDLCLPGIDGIDLCRRLRHDAKRQIPVIMLTARDSLENKLEGFNAGTDDYLAKPFSLKELAARVKVLSERASHKPATQWVVGDLSLDVDAHEVYRAGMLINLNPTLFRLLMFLMQNPHRVITREDLEYAVWKDDPPDSDALRTHISNLRQLIDKPFDSPILHTIRGFGYKLSDNHVDG